jgi:aspartate/methionine/tyrosine aminotransferase
VSDRIAGLEPVGSRVIEPRIEALREQGLPIIPVHGYPLVSPPPHVVSAAHEAAYHTKSSPSGGLLELRESLSRVIGEQYGGALDPKNEILITSGAMHGLRIVLTTLLNPGDEALLITPCYFFGGLIELAGGRIVRVRTDPADGYAIDFDKVRAAITQRTKLLVVSSPVNPTGCVYSREEVEEFIRIAEEFDVILVSDESYDRMVFDGLEHWSPFHYLEARRRTVLIKSFTKSYALPGWRVGYVAADAELIPNFRKVLEWSLLYCPYANQKVALAALDGPQDWLLNIFAEIDRSRRELLAGLSAAQCYQWVRPRGGPFLFLRVCDESGDEAAIADQLLENFGVPAVAGRHFESRGHVRIPYGGTAEAVQHLIVALVEANGLALK